MSFFFPGTNSGRPQFEKLFFPMLLFTTNTSCKSLDICVKLPPFSALKNLRQHSLFLLSVHLFSFVRVAPSRKKICKIRLYLLFSTFFRRKYRAKTTVSYHQNQRKSKAVNLKIHQILERREANMTLLYYSEQQFFFWGLILPGL